MIVLDLGLPLSFQIMYSDDKFPVKTSPLLMPSSLPKMPSYAYVLESSIFPLEADMHTTPSSFVRDFTTTMNLSVILSPDNSISSYRTHMFGTEMQQTDSTLSLINPTSLSSLMNLPDVFIPETTKSLQEQVEPDYNIVINRKNQSSLPSSKFIAQSKSHTSVEDTRNISFSMVSTSKELLYDAMQSSGNTERETKDHVEPLDTLFYQASKTTSISSLSQIHLKSFKELTSRSNCTNINDKPFSKTLTMSVSDMAITSMRTSTSTLVHGEYIN